MMKSIACKLIFSRLDKGPYSTALSYTWGDPTITKAILIDGHALDVTVNLHDALKHLRPSPGSEMEPMWIDAICIDQQDIPERNQQVRQMGELRRCRELYGQVEDTDGRFFKDLSTKTLFLGK